MRRSQRETKEGEGARGRVEKESEKVRKGLEADVRQRKIQREGR